MISDFQIVSLSRENFVHLFSMSDAELAAHGARRMIVDKRPGYPCRVSLTDAAIGETVILTPFKHHDVDSPYQSAGPVFVSESGQTARPAVNEVPSMLKHRLLSVRAYDRNSIMRKGQVVQGLELAETIEQLFSDGSIDYLQLHNAGAGCFNCHVRRA